MSKSVRFFEIIQMLRGAKKPLLARDIADTLEVSVRTIYRDIASLQAMHTPIFGEPGIGYVMRRGYDLPPLNFNIDEAEAISVGLDLISRTGDPGLCSAARSAMRKLQEVVPSARHLIASSWGVEEPPHVDVSMVRMAIREESKLQIQYQDVNEQATDRVIWPLALIYYSDNQMMVSWCELRQDIRHFRLDRIRSCSLQGDSFERQGGALLAKWEKYQKQQSVTTQ